MRLIGLDVGTKRIGLAKADSNVRIAMPHGTIDVDGSEMMQIASFARIYGAHYFVVGLPRNSKGEETAQSRYVRKFVRELKKVLPDAKIRFQDESLTSVEAQRRLEARKKPYEKGDIDAEAAAIILQDFLEDFFGKQNVPDREKATRKKTKKSKKPRGKYILLSVVALLVFLGIGGYIFYRTQSVPVLSNIDCANNQTGDCATIDFEVQSGDSVQKVATGLQEKGLIRNAIVFQVFYYVHHANDAIKPGEYTFSKAMTLDEITGQLVNGASNVFRLTIVPGETIQQIKQKLADHGYKSEEIEAAFSKTYNHPVLADKPAEASLEGYMFGDTYEFYKTDSVEKIITTMLDQLYKTIQDNNLKAGFEAHGFNLYQGITLASIVEQEARSNNDQRIVAQVFYSRLASDRALGSDVTVKYALDLIDPNRQTYTDNDSALNVDSPYNTRKNKGLPPGPICNPGYSALYAVASPSDTNYLFFLTGDDGFMYYSETEEGHQQNISAHCQDLCKTAL